jgi:hypothetical protein
MSTSLSQGAFWIDKFHSKILEPVYKEILDLRNELYDLKIGGTEDVKQSDPT